MAIEKESKCARGRIWVEHIHGHHYELRIIQTSGVDGHNAASLCLSKEELKKVATMIDKMFPDRAECEFAPEADGGD